MREKLARAFERIGLPIFLGVTGWWCGMFGHLEEVDTYKTVHCRRCGFIIKWGWK